MSEAEAGVPLSSQAQEAKEMMQQQLVRKMAVQMIREAEEQERQRRIQEEVKLASQQEGADAVRQRALDQIIAVQEQLVRALNKMKVWYVYYLDLVVALEMTAINCRACVQ